MPETVLDIVAENPQEEHVAEEMEPAAMHEHCSEDRHPVETGAGRKARRDERPRFDELVARAELDQEHEHVEGDESESDERNDAAQAIVVADGEHAAQASPGQ